MDYNNNTDINKNVMGWIPINNDVSISQAKYPRLVAYIKQNFQVNKVYWDVVGGVRLVNASGLYPRFTGNHWAGFTTNPDAAGHACGDKIDYANMYPNPRWFQVNVTIKPDNLVVVSGEFWGRQAGNDRGACVGLSYSDLSVLVSYDAGKRSWSEIRTKSIFFNLLIYAGYPN